MVFVGFTPSAGMAQTHTTKHRWFQMLTSSRSYRSFLETFTTMYVTLVKNVLLPTWSRYFEKNTTLADIIQYHRLRTGTWLGNWKIFFWQSEITAAMLSAHDIWTEDDIFSLCRCVSCKSVENYNRNIYILHSFWKFIRVLNLIALCRWLDFT